MAGQLSGQLAGLPAHRRQADESVAVTWTMLEAVRDAIIARIQADFR
jgi:hypothetical protein